MGLKQLNIHDLISSKLRPYQCSRMLPSLPSGSHDTKSKQVFEHFLPVRSNVKITGLSREHSLDIFGISSEKQLVVEDGGANSVDVLANRVKFMLNELYATFFLGRTDACNQSLDTEKPFAGYRWWRETASTSSLLGGPSLSQAESDELEDREAEQTARDYYDGEHLD